ncbi:MAG: hypothetical protein Q3972_08145 [Corynebacterium sp.]|nr:hypothetical protein [Corynebacterium sp.]
MMLKKIFSAKAAVAAGTAFALTLSGMAFAPRVYAVDATSISAENDDIIDLGSAESFVPTLNLSGQRVTTTGAEGATGLVSDRVNQSDLDSLATGVNNDGNASNNTGVLVAAIVAAIAGFAGAAALVGNFLAGAQ